MNTDRSSRSRRKRLLLLVIAVAMLPAVGVASAGAASNIEGVWSFNGGQIAIQSLSNGTFAGTVVEETKFTECSHPEGQQIWTAMVLQPDGSYWGFHQWYETPTPSCTPNPTAGPTAWRVVEATNGSHILRVCFNEPGGLQPLIALGGAPNNPSEYAAYNVTYGCENSTPTAPLPVVSSNSGTGRSGSSGAIHFNQTVILPGARACIKLGSLKIGLRDPKYDPLKEVVIRIKGKRITGKKVADVRGVKKLKKSILLKGLPNGTYTLKIVATTVLNQKLSGGRTYHSCVRRLPLSSKIKLHGRKSR